MFVVVITAVPSACEVPNFEGPQIQSPPRGFLLVPDSYLQRRMFQHRDAVFQTAWVESVADFSTIHINGHAGVLGLEDVMAAQDSARKYVTDPDVTFGGVEPLRVNGRDAWGWSERVETPSRGLVWVAYRAAIPYDTITYAVEFYSGEPGLKRAAPDTLKAVIATFAIGETKLNLPLMALLGGGLFFALAGVRSRARASAARLQAINLVKVERKTDERGSPPAESARAAMRPQPPTPGAGPANEPR
jgi:hypothetical protein